MSHSPELRMLLDVGTNGEIVIGNQDFLVCSSASAGPAFEGAECTCGMRATDGAIDHVRMTDDGATVEFSNIGLGKPAGICGTGYVDVLAELLRAGVIDKTGRIHEAACPSRCRRRDDGEVEYVVVFAEASAHGQDIVVSQADVQNILRAKAAIYAAAMVLLRALDMTFDDVEEIMVAGAFGSFLNTANAVLIGLLPDLPPEQASVRGQHVAGGREARGDLHELLRGPSQDGLGHDVFRTQHGRAIHGRIRLGELLPAHGRGPLPEGDAGTTGDKESNHMTNTMIAFAGKGGSGKTTLAAMTLRKLIASGVRPILAVDADPNATLGLTLGVDPGETIADLRDRMGEAAQEVSAIPKDRLMDQWLEEVLVEDEGFDLLTMGRPEGPKCYCYVNGLLRRYLDLLRKNYACIIVDCEAGMEYLSRLVINDVHTLVLVAEPTRIGMTTIKRIAGLADSLHVDVHQRILAVNKVGQYGSLPEEVAAAAKAATADGIDKVLEVPFDALLASECANGVALTATSGKLASSATEKLARLATGTATTAAAKVG